MDLNITDTLVDDVFGADELDTLTQTVSVRRDHCIPARLRRLVNCDHCAGLSRLISEKITMIRTQSL